MNIPFTTEQFFNIFREYNTGIFPVQIIFYILSFFAIFLIIKSQRDSSGVISLILAFFWIWMGFVYHILFFTKINPAAYIFGFLFITEGILLLYYGVIRNRITFAYRHDAYGTAAWIMIGYALIIYPLIGHFAGHIYPAAPELSAPCPTTIFTFGLLLFTSSRIPKTILVIPLLWSLLGFSAALNFSVIQDFGLILSGAVLLIMIAYRDFRRAKVSFVKHS
jgi:hypothetical protein